MDLYTTLIYGMLPLYGFGLLGYIAKKKLSVDAHSVSALLVYILAPLITFHAAATTPLEVGSLSLPLLFLVLALVAALIFYWIGGFLFGFGNSKQFLLAATAGSGNAGYFGLGLALVFFTKDQVNLVVLSILGFIAFLHTVGFYLTARGKFTVKESIRRLVRLPVMYAFVLGLLFHLLPVSYGKEYMEVASWLKGSYTVLGMMVVGLSMASLRGQAIDKTFTLAALLAKFFVWPTLAVGVLALNKYILGWYSPEAAQVVWLLSIVPIATNTVTYANLLEVHADVSAVSVLASTVLAIIYIPLVWPLAFSLINFC